MTYKKDLVLPKTTRFVWFFKLGIEFPRTILVLTVMLSLLMIGGIIFWGCIANLDSMVDASMHNQVHCSEVNPDTCENKSPAWDKICTPCEKSYPWSGKIDWLINIEAPEIPAAAITRFSLNTSDGKGVLDAYYIRSHGKNRKTSQTTIVYNHGNFAGIEHYLPRVRYLYHGGYHLVVWDYRGYGKSQPKTPPTGPQLFADTLLLRDHLSQLELDPHRIVYYGFSLGGLVAAYMTRHQEPCALILENPFTSLEKIARHNSSLAVPTSFLVDSPYETYYLLQNAHNPTMILHSQLDDTFPFGQVNQLFKSLKGPKQFITIKNAVHGIDPKQGLVEIFGLELYLDSILSFLQQKAPECLSLR